MLAFLSPAGIRFALSYFAFVVSAFIDRQVLVCNRRASLKHAYSLAFSTIWKSGSYRKVDTDTAPTVTQLDNATRHSLAFGSFLVPKPDTFHPLHENETLDASRLSKHVPRVAFTDTQAPPITREIAADYARRATISREANRAARKAKELARNPTDDARRTTTLKQIDSLDKLINQALRDRDANLFLKLSAAKERLWKLVSPTAGVLKPKKHGSSGSFSMGSGPVDPSTTPQAAVPPADPSVG